MSSANVHPWVRQIAEAITDGEVERHAAPIGPPITLAVVTYNFMPANLRRIGLDGKPQVYSDGTWRPVRFAKVNRKGA